SVMSVIRNQFASVIPGVLLLSCAAPQSEPAKAQGAHAGAVEAASHSGTHPFGVDDMLAMERITDPQPSPDGKRILFNQRTTDLAANKGRTDLCLIKSD